MLLTTLGGVAMRLPVAGAAAILKVQYKAGDTAASANQIKPHLAIVNTGDAPAALSELKARYYYTRDTAQAQSYFCDYAAVGCGNVTGSFVQLASATTGADFYLEVGFTAAAGSVAAGGTSGEIQSRFAKSDWSNYTQTGDYSFDPTKTAFADWSRVTLHRAGVLIWGAEPGGSGATSTATRTNTPPTAQTATATRTNTPPTTQPASPTRTATSPAATATRTTTNGVPPTATTGLRVQYRAAETGASANQLKPWLNIVNGGTAGVALSELKARYYYSKEGTANEQYFCDYAVVGCGNVTGSFATGYLEIGFGSGAGTLAAGGQTGEIQNRFAKTDWSPYTQTGDYSFDPTKTAFADWNRVGLFRGGTLVWGVVPPVITLTPTTSAPVTATRTSTSVQPTSTRTSTSSQPTSTRTSTQAVSPTPTSTSGGSNLPPAAPVITEPFVDGKVVNPGDVHMETGLFSDPDAGQTHRCTDWEIWNVTQTERVWFTACIGGVERLHTHLGDGVYQGTHAGRTALLPETDYVLRVRHRDSSLATNDWSAYAARTFRTSAVTIGNPNQKWALRQTGYELEIVASNLQMPVNIAFKPNAGTAPGDAYYYVTELYGTIKVVRRDGSMSDYATGLLNYNPSGLFPGSGEQGLTGIAVEPVTGDIYAGMLYKSASGANYPKVVRFTSANGGLTAATQTTILDMVGESQGQSHQISNITIGPDGKLYVHLGDGFDSTTGQNQNSFRGKILRMNLDGSPATDNPLYSAADGINARDYIYAYGFRNPFGGAWRQADGAHYELSNGPTIDRFAKVVAGRNYGWDGTENSMRNFAISSWAATGPVNIAFVQPGTFGGSGFPADKQGHAYLSHSGCTYCTGPGNKRIDEWVLNADGSLLSGPVKLLEYTGTGRATVVGLAAGPDGLYFTDFYADAGSSPTARGANVYRIRKLN